MRKQAPFGAGTDVEAGSITQGNRQDTSETAERFRQAMDGLNECGYCTEAVG